MAETTGTQAIDRAAQLLVRVVESAQPPSVGELARARRPPEEHDLAARLGARAPGARPARSASAAGCTAGPVLLRYANRDVSSTLVELAAPSLRRLADASRRDDQPRRPRRRRRRAPRAGGHRALRRRHRLGRPQGAVRARRERQVLPRLRRRAPPKQRQPIRARGYATSIDELEVGLTALAAPVFGPRRRRARRALHLRARPPA